MSKFDEIVDAAIERHGVVTSAEATALGVALKDMKEWVDNGRLEKVGRGVFRLSKYPCNEYSHYAEAVALVGDGAWICGESVLAMHNLALVNPLCTLVATTKRVRRNLPEWIKVVRKDTDEEKDYFDGIPVQNLAMALIEAKDYLMRERFVQAVRDAQARGLLTVSDSERIKKAMST